MISTCINGRAIGQEIKNPQSWFHSGKNHTDLSINGDKSILIYSYNMLNARVFIHPCERSVQLLPPGECSCYLHSVRMTPGAMSVR
jgi:hypothetical protein